MNNKLIKTFASLLTIFIMFFIGSNNVKADDTCYWESPLTYIQKNGKSALIDSSFEYETAGVGKVGPDARIISNVLYFLLKYTKDAKGHIGYAIPQISPNPQELSLNKHGGYNIYLDGQGDYIYDFDFKKSSCKDQKYVYVQAYFSGTANVLGIKSATEEEYKSYLKNGGQYLENTHTFFAFTTKDDTTRIVDDAYFELGHRYNFWDYVYETKGIYLINTNIKDDYPNKNYNKLVKEIESSGNNMSKEEIDSIFQNLKIDPSDKNSITHNKIYYDATKDAWDKCYREGDDCIAKSTFLNWFTNVSRYLLEEDVSKFKEYFIFANKHNVNKDSNYDIIIDVLNGMISLEENDDKKSCIESNPCSVFCHSGKNATNFVCSGTAFDQCSAGSDDYKKCSAAYKACEGARKGSSSTAYDDCMKVNMGEDLYKKYEDDKKTISDAIDQEKKDIVDGIVAALRNVSTPKLKIHFTGDYKVKCEDVVIFHDLYIILRIAAPILVVVFGSLDYARAVLASDAEKMEKSKKKFPKRLILVVLFMLIPVVINLILSLFAQSTKIDVSTNLMYCILKG